LTATQTSVPIVLPSHQELSASGEWQMEVASGPSTTYGVAYIKADKSVVYGHGQDPAGSYMIQGTITSGQVRFIKRYDEEACINGAHRQDIAFSGLLSTPPGSGPQIDGKYETQVKSGFPTSYFKKSQWQTVTGRWSARKIGELPAQLSLQMDSRQASWNPLRDLDAQPVQDAQAAKPEPPKTPTEAIVFYSVLATAVLAAFGWLMYVIWRYIERWSES